MSEEVVVKKIKEYMLKVHGVTMHKYHGGTFGETAVADLFGTMPDGRAIYIEVKKPFTLSEKKAFLKTERYLNQKAWLTREAKNNAIAMFALSVEDVDKSIKEFKKNKESSIKSGVFAYSLM